MKRKLIVAVVTFALAVSVGGPSLAADPVSDWGDAGVATITPPVGGTANDAALLTDGRMVVVGSTGTAPWGAVLAADGDSFVLLSVPATTADAYDAVAVAGNRIYAIGSYDTGSNTAGFAHVYSLSGALLDTSSFGISENTFPSNAVAGADNMVYVAGAGTGDDDGVEPGWVVRLTADGDIDPAFGPVILLNPDNSASEAWVGVSDGSIVAAVYGDSTIGSAIGFHRVTASGSTFMADLYTADPIVGFDVDSSSGTAVVGTIAADTLTSVNYSVSTVGPSGVTTGTTVGTDVDLAGKIEVGRLRTGELLAAFEGGVNTLVKLVASDDSFATRADSELADIDVFPGDGSVFVTVNDAGGSGAVVVVRYGGDTSGRFVDDDASVHEMDIERLAELGVTRGCNPPSNDRYCPTERVTRGQMAAFLVRALSLPAGTPDQFVDDDSSIFESAIDALATAGITRGCNPPTNDRFCPNDYVTRGQMAAFLTRGFALPPGVPDRFVDDDGSIFEADIDALAAAGITQGCNPPTNDRYCPTDYVTREQMASFLVRAVDGP